MKRLIKKYKTRLPIILLLIFSICKLNVSGQTAAETLAFAINQLNAGNFSLANKALHRVVFFDTEFNHPEALELLAESYFKMSDYNNAHYYFDLASVQTENDSLKAEYTFRKVLCDLNLGEYQDAKIDLLSFDSELTLTQQWNYNLLTGITTYHLEEYDESLKYFLMCSDSSDRQAIFSQFSMIDKLEKRYNPKTARVLSIILPGSGQVYAGDYKNGINSIALVTALAAAATSLAVSITFIDAAVVIFPWFQRYYMGGYQRAYIITQNKQMNKKKELLLSILDHL